VKNSRVFLTKTEAAAGGESPISQTVTRALPKPLALSSKCEHSTLSEGGLNCATCVSFITASRKQVPPATERFTYKTNILDKNSLKLKACSTMITKRKT